MGIKSISNFAVKVIAMLLMATIVVGISGYYTEPVTVNATAKYDTLYDVFKARSGHPDTFMSQEDFRSKVLSNCKKLNGVGYTSGRQDNYLACDGFVSMVFRLTFGTVHEFSKHRDKIWFKFYPKEEHIVAQSYVDKYEIYRPGGTSVTWLYNNYVEKIVPARGSKRKKVEDYSNKQWVNYLTSINAQPGDIIMWDNDTNYTYWTHIGIYAGIEDGKAKMWHASSVKKKVLKQNMSEITEDVGYLKFACVVPLTDVPAKIGLFAEIGDNTRDFSYTVYKDEACKSQLGRIASSVKLNEESKLGEILLYPNSDKSAYERTLYLVRDTSPYKTLSASVVGEDQTVYRIKIRIEPGEEHVGVLKYSIYEAKNIRSYGGKTIEDYDYYAGGLVIPITDFR
ncbi:MAG: hypothetical protein MJ098_07135 [Saccharofermentans sp.]|nr:hypothetical protein [Saccharofermentans sp.]